MLFSQSDPAAGRWLSAIPTCPEVRFSYLRMQVSLRRRLRWALPLGPRRCDGRSCQLPLDRLGDQWAACSWSGRLRRRERPLERAWTRVLREGGARVLENVMLRDTNLEHIEATDDRQLEIVASRRGDARRIEGPVEDFGGFGVRVAHVGGPRDHLLRA